MKVVVITSLREKCGIGIYSLEFINNLLKYDRNREVKKLLVITHKNSSLHKKLGRDNRVIVSNIIDERNFLYIKKVFSLINNFQPDIVNIEWDHSLYSPKPFLGIYMFPIVYKFRHLTFISLHSLYKLQDIIKFLRFSKPAFLYYGLTKEFLVHIPRAIRVFTYYEYEQLPFVNRLKFLIPQGIKECKMLSPPSFSRFINLSIFGFIRETKNYELAINTLKYLPKNFRLIIAGYPHNFKILKTIKKYVDTNPSLRGRVKIIPKFLTEREKISLFRISHVILLPYTLISNSAVICECLKYGRPIVTTVLKKDIERMGIGKYSRSELFEFSSAITDVIDNYKQYYQRIKMIRENFFWNKIIIQILNAYKMVRKEA